MKKIKMLPNISNKNTTTTSVRKLTFPFGSTLGVLG